MLEASHIEKNRTQKGKIFPHPHSYLKLSPIPRKEGKRKKRKKKKEGGKDTYNTTIVNPNSLSIYSAAKQGGREKTEKEKAEQKPPGICWWGENPRSAGGRNERR